MGKTTGWTHRIQIKKRGVKMVAGVEYKKINDEGLHIIVNGEAQILDVDTVILCAGQNPLRELYNSIKASGKKVSLIGGADVASELDAKRAIDQATRCALAV